MKDLKTGMMVFIALLLFIFSILFVGNFKKTTNYKIKFKKVLGLKSDAPVLLNGVEVGRVSKIHFSSNTNDNMIYVDISLGKSVMSRINNSTLADIQTMGVLGDKFVSLETKTFSAQPLEEGDMIKVKEALDYEGMIEQGKGILDNMTEMTVSLNKLANSVKTGKGLLGILIKDPELGKSLLTSISIVTDNLKNGTGFLGKLINDKEFCARMSDSLNNIFIELQGVTEGLNNTNGFAGTLIHDKEFSNNTKQSIINVLNGFEIIGKKFAEAENDALLGVILKDKEAGENLKQSLKHLKNILEKIDNGKGTLGKMVNEPELYNNANLVFSGAKNSKIVKKVMKHYKKKGEENSIND